LEPDLVKIWNVAHLIDSDDKMKLLHRTSNGLESYNKHFNSICPTSHLNLVSFAHALRQEVDRVVQCLDVVAKGREVPPDYNELVFLEIHPDFYSDEKKATARIGTRKGHSKRGGD
jgi:hypothetical protein